MKLVRYILLVTALGMVTTPVRAEVTVNEMFQRIDRGTKMIREFHLTILQGNLDGLTSANSYLASQKAAEIFCLPQGKTFRGEQIMAMLRAGVASDRDLGKRPLGFAVLQVFQRTYPCPSRSN